MSTTTAIPLESPPTVVDRTRSTRTARPDLAKTLQLVLRVSMAGTYIGHGAFGIIGKASWLPYFNLFGFSDSQAWTLMPIVGTMDITLGILILLWPTRLSMLHLAFWGVLTAMFRPLTGEGLWEEVFERGGNYAAAMSLLVLSGVGGFSIKGWVGRVSEAPELTRAKAITMHWLLRVGTALLLVGHGGYGVWMHKKVWLTYFSQLGLDSKTVADLNLFYVIGWFEIALGLAVLLKPLRPLLVAVCAYKVFTELLRPAAGEPWWEFIERSGSYLCPVGLVLVDTWLRRNPETPALVPAAGSSRVLVVDDDPAVRDLLRLVLDLEGGFTVVGEAVDGRQAIEMARELRPDLVLLDLLMPGMSGDEAIEELARVAPNARLAVLTALDPDSISSETIAGVHAVYDKSADLSDVTQELVALVGARVPA
ncbi:MAG: hypothetical protein QOD92_3140 [Acidimicrobiaceae bacterium]|jgi:CheY-like chemotaxis protein